MKHHQIILDDDPRLQDISQQRIWKLKMLSERRKKIEDTVVITVVVMLLLALIASA